MTDPTPPSDMSVLEFLAQPCIGVLNASMVRQQTLRPPDFKFDLTVWFREKLPFGAHGRMELTYLSEAECRETFEAVRKIMKGKDERRIERALAN